MRGKHTLRQGLIRRIGNGQSTRIWNDNRLPRNEMMRPYGCLSNNPPELVSELIDSASATWDRQKVLVTFLPMDARTILGIPLCTSNMEDFWSWSHEKKGLFSVKSAYRMLVSTRQRREAWLENREGSSTAAKEEGA